MRKKTIQRDLKKLPFFNKLSPDEILFLTPYLKEKVFEKDEVILPQGSEGGDLYLILSGVVTVKISLPGNYKKDLTTLGAYQVFGEVTFLSNTLVTASVVAQRTCRCLIVFQNILEMLRIAKPEIAFKIEQEIGNQIASKIIFNIDSIFKLVKKIPEKFQISSELAIHLEKFSARSSELNINDIDRNRIKNLSYFRRLTESQISRLLPLLTVKTYEKGYRFLGSKANPNRIALIYEGAVMFFIKENNQLKKYLSVSGIGELFMQNFIFPEFCQIADYVACEKCTLIELDMETYHKLHDSDPALFYIISESINRAIAASVYITNRQFVRISSEYINVLSKRDQACVEF
jgi:CRP-like cAMP-binding protein